jgi:hypothetical protein
VVEKNAKIWPMRKDMRLSFRVRSDLKKTLETIAATEGRSVAQVCEAFLIAGADRYRKDGTTFLQLVLNRPTRKSNEK